MAQTPHDARAGLAQALLNESCLGSAPQTRSIWPSIPPHENNGLCLSCYHLVCHSTSFLSPLMSPPPRHPNLARGRLLLVFVRHQPRHRLAQWLLHVHEDVSYHARTIVFTVVGRLIRLSCLRPVLPPPTCCPCPWLQPRADRCLSTRVRGESFMLLAFLRACLRGGHGGTCHA
jgi:hypothetical protein